MPGPAVPRDLPEFLRAIEAAGELRRVSAEVDAELEITEITRRVLRRVGGPALLFERVRGSPYPLAINVFSSPRRLEIAFGRPPEEIGAEIFGFLERLNPPSLGALFSGRRVIARALNMRVRRRSRAVSQEIEEDPNLDALPILKCWPGDGGRFITYPLVITTGKGGRERNLGLYRMHVHSPTSTGMHWQIQKGGGFHHHQAEKEGRPLEVAVAIGADPVLLFAAMSPLPEGVDEIAFSGFLRGKPSRLTRARTLALDVPANAEFVLEGVVPAGERQLEGPFGDHYGHYSHAADFPVFHIRKITRRRDPIYLAAVVGKPPQEDMYLGNAAQEIFSPILRMMRPEIRDLWSYYEGGFHTLLVVSMESRYRREGIKTALGLLGEGQLSLTKWVVVVNHNTSPRDFPAVLAAIRENFDPGRDLLLLPGTSMDTLDFTSFRMNLGSKMVLDATGDLGPAPPGAGEDTDPGLAGSDLGIRETRILEDCLLALVIDRKFNSRGREILQHVLRRPHLARFKMIVAVSDDVDLRDPVSFLWGFLTRFEPARDILFPHAELRGICPAYRGPMGIDATFKEGYPAPLEMDPEIIARVDQRWSEYFPDGL